MGDWLKVAEIAGKGRGLLAAKDIPAGQPLLQEMPLMLVVGQDHVDSACAGCLRWLEDATISCSSCHQARYCSPACQLKASSTPGSHGKLVCRVLAGLSKQQLTPEQQSSLRFLTQALDLREASASDTAAKARYDALLGLSADAGPAADDAGVLQLHKALTSCMGGSPAFTLEEVHSLLCKEQGNGYGIMAPRHGPERLIRGTALYAKASLLNHDCLPAAVRFDDFDSQGDSNSAISFYARCNIPAGEEVTASYLPLHISFAGRQRACTEVFGFVCACPRCQEESTWPPEEEAGSDSASDHEDAGHHAADLHDAQPEHASHKRALEAGSHDDQTAKRQATQSAGAGSDTADQHGRHAEAGTSRDSVTDPGVSPEYIELFLHKHLCQEPDCFGTLAPVGETTQVLTCNACKATVPVRSDTDILAELEQADTD